MYTPWLNDWLAMIWPQNLDGFFASGIKGLMSRIDSNSSTWEPNFTFLKPLLEPDRLFSEMAILMVWLAVVGKDVDARAYAIDVLADGISDGRISAEPFARILHKLSQGGWLKLNRLSESLSEVARFSSLHALVVAEILLLWLDEQKELPHNAHSVLSLLYEILLRLGLPVSEKSGIFLQSIKGSSKTAKIAKNLLNYKPPSVSADYLQARLQVVKARIMRAERWQTGLSNL